MSDAANHLIVCSTARLSRGLQLHYQQQLASQQQQWLTPQIMTLQQWLSQLHQQGILAGEVDTVTFPMIHLNAMMEKMLWQQSIQSCIQKHELAALFDVDSLADAAIAANQLLIEWQVNDSQLDDYYQPVETRQFLRWRMAFESLCREKNALECARLLALQVDYVANSTSPLPATIQLAGFDRITPLEQRLIDNLTLKNVHVTLFSQQQNHQIPAQVTQVIYDDCDAECRAAVAWAKQHLTLNSKLNLAIITPVLGNIRNKLADLLDDTFHPETLHPNEYEKPRLMDFSVGAPLSEHAMIATALRLLRLACSAGNSTQAELSALLLDVHWSAENETDARHLLDAHMRKKLARTVSLQSLIGLAEKMPRLSDLAIDTADPALLQPKQLLEHLTILQEIQTLWRGKHLPSFWAAQFKTVLDHVNWAKTRPLSSHDYQAQQSWLEILHNFDDLNGLTGPITAMDAVSKLSQMCAARMFLPETKGDTRIQLLGMLENSAIPLDGAWVLGMNDQHWPPPARPNPLLPIQLQRDLCMPNADTDIQAEFAHKVQQRLLNSASKIIFSWARKEADRELRASPLLKDYPIGNADWGVQTVAETLAHIHSENISGECLIESLNDYMAPPISATEMLRGGSALFEAQAVCPAWAFYQYRLGAKALESPTDGLDTLERGNLVHAVLQQFWIKHIHSLNLKSLSEIQLENATKTAIDAAFQDARNLEHVPDQILQIERQRLQLLINTWLQLEKQRADFVVIACEAEHHLVIEGLEITLIIDRIDAVLSEADQQLIIIDYKTGSNKPSQNSWADKRITKPQIPLYASLVLKDNKVVAACFAKLDVLEPQFIGVAEKDILPNITPFAELKSNSVFKNFDDFEALTTHWRDSLTAIAQEIKTGVACVKFEQESDLQYCDAKPLLRLPERALQFEQQTSAL